MLRYNSYNGYDIERDYKNPVFKRDLENLYKIYNNLSYLKLKKYLSICKSIVTEKERYENAFFEAVRTIIVKISSDVTLLLPEINEQISISLNQSIKSTAVINVIILEISLLLGNFDFFKNLPRKGQIAIFR